MNEKDWEEFEKALDNAIEADKHANDEDHKKFEDWLNSLPETPEEDDTQVFFMGNKK